MHWYSSILKPFNMAYCADSLIPGWLVCVAGRILSMEQGDRSGAGQPVQMAQDR